MGIGFEELLLVLLIGLISLAIPIATLVGVFLVYGKVKNIEQTLHPHLSSPFKEED